jgi:hypothetical protein
LRRSPARLSSTQRRIEYGNKKPFGDHEEEFEEIDEKINAMLAASNALKPIPNSGAQRNHKPQRRGTGKVLNKVVQALGSLHNRSPGSGSME